MFCQIGRCPYNTLILYNGLDFNRNLVFLKRYTFVPVPKALMEEKRATETTHKVRFFCFCCTFCDGLRLFRWACETMRICGDDGDTRDA